MIKIKFIAGDIHRNETTFRPYVINNYLFESIGIHFDFDMDSYDIAFVAQASIIDKKLSLEKSIEKGVEFLRKVDGPTIVIDGQDSTSLIGTVDVIREHNVMLFLKNTLLADRSLYKNGYVNGRIYWGEGDYKVPDIENFDIKLSGTNWLSTIGNPTFYNMPIKRIDVSAMFQYPMHKPVYEHELLQNTYYDKFRKILLDKLGNIKSISINKLENGIRLPINQYYQKMADCKIIVAPFGYGEMAPRDIEAPCFNSVLIKPDMGHIDSIPNFYIPDKTYIPCKWDFSDIEEKIDYVLSDFEHIRDELVYNAKLHFEEAYHPEKLVLHFYDLLKNLNEVNEE